MAEDKKTQLGTTAAAAPTHPAAADPASISTTIKTSYLPAADDPLIDTTIAGRYHVDKKLGEGGMGSVYLATHNILEKQVALKVLHGEFARKQDLVERFMQEAKAASRIRHENVIDISDFGATPEGIVFFAMELLTGHDLHDEIARARLSGHLLPWSRTKRIFLQVCSALSAAHARGIVHRDLKPENVYLVEFLGDPDFVKLLDFGIAKLTEVDGEGGRKLTKTGMLFGTPEYMSPEQARGEPVDHRVDIYAMGCILFQLVTGRVPFEADNFMGVLSLHLTEAPPVIAPETFDHIGAPRALAGVIDRALAKDRAERWQTIDELAAAVREVSGDPPAAERSGRTRAASVPAPSATVTPARAQSPTARQITQWTGNVRVPEAADEPPPRRRGSKLPIAIAAVVVAAGGVVAYVATRGGEPAPQPAGLASASAPQPAPPPPAPPPPPPHHTAPPPEPALPAQVSIAFESTPPGATVTDVATGKPIGRTPTRVTVPGSKTARRYTFHLHGFADATSELVPDHDGITEKQALARAVADPGRKPAAGSSAEPATGPVTHPDVGSGSATPPPPKDDCPDDEQPCLKRNIPGLGSGSS
ncbi:MAG TPA: serine/threonine-protein kinase [Kofleriaceae bacterium]|nr:serine/threonine-protein kinase [Kofleriaceae bacterium]